MEGVSLFPGYLGAMTLPTDPAGPDAGHTFTVGLGQVLLDGAPFAIEWTGTMRSAENELYNALSYNAACYPGYDPTPCETTGDCAVTTAGSQRQLSIPAIGLTLGFDLAGTEASRARSSRSTSCPDCHPVKNCHPERSEGPHMPR